MPKRTRLRCRDGRSLLHEALNVARDLGQAGRPSSTFSIAAQYEMNRVHPGWRKLVASAYIDLAILPADLDAAIDPEPEEAPPSEVVAVEPVKHGTKKSWKKPGWVGMGADYKLTRAAAKRRGGGRGRSLSPFKKGDPRRFQG